MTNNMENGQRPKRAAAYIRVSTENESQEESYETQERYFSCLLRDSPDLISAGIYSDYGISATSSDNRSGFKRLIRHCKDGRIDVVICKSISRFSRNTADFLNAVEQLKSCGVALVFEKEGLNTSQANDEFVLTLLAALAQQESRTVSENILWGIQSRFRQGQAQNYDIYGYRFVDDRISSSAIHSLWDNIGGEHGYRSVEIHEKEAQIVQYIFEKTAAGISAADIARELNGKNISPPRTRKKEDGFRAMDIGWTGDHIRSIIKQERYCGSVRVQKTYTPDFLTHKPRKNNGEMPRYLLKNHHPAIITEELFKEAQSNKKRAPAVHTELPFSGLIRCSDCGRFFTTGNRRNNPIWHCPLSALNNGKNLCNAERIYEEKIIFAIKKAADERFRLYEKNNFSEVKNMLFEINDTDNYESEIDFIKKHIRALKSEIRLARDRINAAEKEKALRDELRAAEISLNEKESCRRSLEKSDEKRIKAFGWLSKLPESSEGKRELLSGISGEFAKAFILEMTAYSSTKLKIRWIDSTVTEVTITE